MTHLFYDIEKNGFYTDIIFSTITSEFMVE